LIAVDTNILVYAHREDSPFHDAASKRIAELAEGSATWSIPWPCVHEFLAIVTHPRIYAPPTPLPRALDQVDAWLEAPTLASGRVNRPLAGIARASRRRTNCRRPGP
jgi:predicted nucleic acid-binding protein